MGACQDSVSSGVFWQRRGLASDVSPEAPWARLRGGNATLISTSFRTPVLRSWKKDGVGLSPGSVLKQLGPLGKLVHFSGSI